MARLIKVADWNSGKRCNVVFVHGLGGHPYDTWRSRPNNNSFWPLWAAEDVKGLAVFSLGYVSPPTNWFGTAMPLLDEAANVLRQLLVEPELKIGPISFVCHSLGGLLIKQVLRSAKEQRSDGAIADFFERIKEVVFIATPHTGLPGKATLMERTRFLVWSSESARDLVANNAELRDLNIGYRGLAEERREQLHHLVYYEMSDTIFGRIVAPDFSDPGLPNCKPVPIAEDHTAICKPRSRQDLVYAETKEFLAKITCDVPIEAKLQTYELPPFGVPWSWGGLVPKLVRVGLLLGFIAAGWTGFHALRDFAS